MKDLQYFHWGSDCHNLFHSYVISAEKGLKLSIIQPGFHYFHFIYVSNMIV
jgi:hypothetical protein